ncbi:MAG TPA: carboxymuconolactone decarboxylase family protein [Acidimicrobiales bacterium]|nr:carboxymuconolactone decarboxylase family protein [Acidimicrobiales bacterium]
MSKVESIRPRDWPAGLVEKMAAALKPEGRDKPLPPRDPDAPKGLNAMGVMAHHPDVTLAFNHLVSHVNYDSTLSARQRELLVLRVAHVRGSTYEWGQHVYQGGQAGITPDEVERVRVGPSAEGWSPFERALVRAADELVRDARIGDDTYDTLSAELDTRQLMDVVFTVGAYDAFAMFLRTFDVAVDRDLADYAAF